MLLFLNRSEQREYAQHLCGWTFDRNKDTFNQFVDSLCNKQEFTRAAMIACFQLKIRLAIDILGRGADRSMDSSNLRMAAIALSGFCFDKSAIWRTQCATAQTQLTDPHLRTIFAFLIPENPSYDKVLVGFVWRTGDCLILNSSPIDCSTRAIFRWATEWLSLVSTYLTPD